MSVNQSCVELSEQTAWPLDRVKDQAWKIGSGITPRGGATTYLDTGIPLLRSQNVHFDGLRLDDVAYISEETHREMNSTNTRPCDVLLNITGASIGRCSFALDIFCRPAAFVGYPSFLFAKSDDHPVVKPIWT